MRQLIPILVLLAVAGSVDGGNRPGERGLVTATDGRPLAGARVILAWGSVWPETQREIEACQATTDEQGEFELPSLPSGNPNPGLRPLFAAYAPGRAIGHALRQPDPLHFSLGPEVRLPVRVVTADGSPVPGVTVRVEGELNPAPPGLPKDKTEWINFGTPISRLLIPPTAADGRTVIPALTPEAKVNLCVRDPEWVQAEKVRELRVALTGESLQPEYQIVVRRAASVRGILTSDRGRPLAGYRVSLQPRSGDEVSPEWAVTNADGSFVVAGLAGGSYSVGLNPPVGEGGVEAPQPNVDVAPGQRREGYRIEKPTGSLITARFVFADTGLPVVGATPHYGKPGDCLGYSGPPTDAQGRFRMRVRPGDAYYGFYPPPGYDVQWIHFEPGDHYPQLKKAENGQDYDLGEFRVRLRKLRPIRGRVVKADGSPAAGALVYYRLINEAPDSLERTEHVTAGADGAFETPAHQPWGGGVYRVRALLGPESTAADAVVSVVAENPPDPVRLELKTRALAVVRGAVTDEAGAPVVGASVAASNGTSPSTNTDPRFPLTDAAGRFEFRLWPDDEYQFGAGYEGYGNTYASPIKPAPGQTVTLPPLVLHKPTAVLDVLFTDWAGVPLRNVPVELENPAGQPFVVRNPYQTNGAGRLRVSGLVPGTYRLYYGHARVEGAAPTGKPRYRISLPRPEDPAQPVFRSP